ncbi:hypothetical protein [Aquibium carbonis]|uniref:hypothetical protein n=1 Tax=Aquibium carbonis TaxID=2495581 RepID=UPI001478ECF2|nr:hypothetical protein [Aquibium carbonis]
MRVMKSMLLAAAFTASSILPFASTASATGCTGADCSQSQSYGGSGCSRSKADPVSS